MTRHKVSTPVYLEPRQVAALRARSARTGETRAAIIRRAIDRELAPEPVDPFHVLAALAPEFFATLTDKEAVVLAHAWGLR